MRSGRDSAATSVPEAMNIRPCTRHGGRNQDGPTDSYAAADRCRPSVAVGGRASAAERNGRPLASSFADVSEYSEIVCLAPAAHEYLTEAWAHPSATRGGTPAQRAPGQCRAARPRRGITAGDGGARSDALPPRRFAGTHRRHCPTYAAESAPRAAGEPKSLEP